MVLLGDRQPEEVAHQRTEAVGREVLLRHRELALVPHVADALEGRHDHAVDHGGARPQEHRAAHLEVEGQVVEADDRGDERVHRGGVGVDVRPRLDDELAFGLARDDARGLGGGHALVAEAPHRPDLVHLARGVEAIARLGAARARARRTAAPTRGASARARPSAPRPRGCGRDPSHSCRSSRRPCIDRALHDSIQTLYVVDLEKGRGGRPAGRRHRERLRRPGGGRTARRARMGRHGPRAARPARRARARLPAGRLRLRRWPDRHHGAPALRGAVVPLRRNHEPIGRSAAHRPLLPHPIPRRARLRLLGRPRRHARADRGPLPAGRRGLRALPRA